MKGWRENSRRVKKKGILPERAKAHFGEGSDVEIKQVLFGFKVSLGVERFRRYRVGVGGDVGDCSYLQEDFDSLEQAVVAMRQRLEFWAGQMPRQEIYGEVVDLLTGEAVKWDNVYFVREVCNVVVKTW